MKIKKKKKEERDTYIHIYIYIYIKIYARRTPCCFHEKRPMFLENQKKKKAISELENTVIKLEAKSFFKKC